MPNTTIDTWNPDFVERSLMFKSIREVSQPLSTLGQWPTLEQFALEFNKKIIQSHAGKLVRPVAQAGTPQRFEDLYESRIYQAGELQTRLENWHDFFNAMCWLQFPKIKSALNALHYESSTTRQVGTNRNPLENALTLFDECGAIIVADDDALLEMIRQHEWQALFRDNSASWENKEGAGQHIQCIVFGHAMYEKNLTPYLGMTTHSVLVKHGGDFFQKTDREQLGVIDQVVSDLWMNNRIEQPRDLHPFPVLGVPGWWVDAQDDAFYANTDYFRPKAKMSR